MQGLADGYFVLPYTIQNYLAAEIMTPRCRLPILNLMKLKIRFMNGSINCMQIKGNQPVIVFTGNSDCSLWDPVGMARNKEGLDRSSKGIQPAAAGILD